MTQGAKIGLIVGGVAVLGVGLYFILRRRPQPYVPPVQPNNVNVGNNGAPSINWGGIVTTIIDSLPKNVLVKKDNNNNVIEVVQPTTRTAPGQQLYVNTSLYNENEVKSMQSYLVSLGGQSKMWVDTTGGVDGKIGNGFKNAYTWAVVSGQVLDIDDLYKKSGAKK